MGYMKHNAIVFHSHSKLYTEEAHKFAIKENLNPSEILISKVNQYYSFFIPTDGSKEGWEQSDEGDANRKTFMDFCESKQFEDGSNSYAAVEIEYDDDDGENNIIRRS